MACRCRCIQHFYSCIVTSKLSSVQCSCRQDRMAVSHASGHERGGQDQEHCQLGVGGRLYKPGEMRSSKTSECAAHSVAVSSFMLQQICWYLQITRVKWIALYCPNQAQIWQRMATRPSTCTCHMEKKDFCTTLFNDLGYSRLALQHSSMQPTMILQPDKAPIASFSPAERC